MLDKIDAQVALLVKPHRREVWQDLGPELGGRSLRVVFTPPLLDQLEQAIGSGGGTGAAGVGEKRTRAVIDPGAAELWWAIRRQVGVWLSDQHAHQTTLNMPPKQQLIAWHRNYRRAFGQPTMPDPADAGNRYLDLKGWVSQIEAKFDPPKTIEILASCPICHSRHRTDRDTGDISSALVALVRGEGRISVVCRACGESWEDEREIRVLAARVV